MGKRKIGKKIIGILITLAVLLSLIPISETTKAEEDNVITAYLMAYHGYFAASFKFVYDDDDTVGDFKDDILQQVEVENGVHNVQVILDDNPDLDNDTLLKDLTQSGIHVAFSADENTIVVVGDYASKDTRWINHNSGLYNLKKVKIVSYESGDTYQDMIDKLGEPSVVPDVKTDMAFLRWVPFTGANNYNWLPTDTVESRTAGSPNNIVVRALYNYRFACIRLISGSAYEDEYSWLATFTGYGTGGPREWGSPVDIYALIPTDKDITYEYLANILPKNWRDAIRYTHQDDYNKVISAVNLAPLNDITLDVTSAYHSSDWETIWAGEYVFPDNKGEDNGGSTYEPVRPSDAQVQEAVAQIVELENTATDANKESLTIDMKQDDGNIATVVPVEILEQIKGKNIDVTLDMGEYSWTINGKNVTADTLKDINLEVKIGDKGYWPDSFDDKYSKEWLEMVRNSNPFLCMSLTHDGEFGFEATLNINVGMAYSGKYGNLYYFNDGFLEFIRAAKVDANGNASLAFTHASDYAIVISDEASVTPNDTPADTSPDTGDHSHLGIYTLVAVIAVAGITSTIIYKKKAFEK